MNKSLLNSPFSGSYKPNDCIFLLKPVNVQTTAVEEKERAIQSGRRHYSEMLSVEKTPDARYMSLFYQALTVNAERFARDIARLARSLAARNEREVVLVSLARAGTPVGVLLKRALDYLRVPAVHYSLSIIRDRGIDAVALDYIGAHHRSQDAVFVDGWTGKGAIAGELRSSVGAYNESRGTRFPTQLACVADLAGVADLAATAADYLIPSSILNAIVSGLVSRTVLNDEYVGPGDFHACMFYEEKRDEDLSNYFVDRITPLVEQMLCRCDVTACQWNDEWRASLREESEAFVAWAMRTYGLSDRNRVKPGIGESTRALLRRVPDCLIVKDAHATDVAHLVRLAETHGVPIEVNEQLAYRAAVIIKSLGE